MSINDTYRRLQKKKRIYFANHCFNKIVKKYIPILIHMNIKK